jgi:hypothetical protein
MTAWAIADDAREGGGERGEKKDPKREREKTIRVEQHDEHKKKEGRVGV